MSVALKPLGMREFQKLERQNKYWKGRWAYLRHIAFIVRDLRPHKVLEVGPGQHRFVPGSHTMDLDASVKPTFVHDAGAAPWPVPSESYDLVIGLQCWEHFKGRQAAAFGEALRVAGADGHVVLSLPYLWTNTNAIHRGIDDERILSWTRGVEPERRVHVRNPKDRQRMILLYRGRP